MVLLIAYGQLCKSNYYIFTNSSVVHIYCLDFLYVTISITLSFIIPFEKEMLDIFEYQVKLNLR